MHSVATMKADPVPRALPTFEAVYDAHADFVYRGLRRLGVADAVVEDAFQEVFLVVLRKLPTFEGRSAVTTWLYGIMLHVARSHRRSTRRRMEDLGVDAESAAEARDSVTPERGAEQHEAVRLLYDLLATLDDDKREVFVLSELEELSAPEIAAMLGQNLNTIYARIRAARQSFEQAVSRHRAKDEFRTGNGRTP